MSSSSLKDVTGKDSENGSNSSASNGEGGGNNSDNSALVSLGNTSFGFNFESDGGFNNSSGSNSPSEEGDSDQGDRKPNAQKSEDCNQGSSNGGVVGNGDASTAARTASSLTATTSTLTESSPSDEEKGGTDSQPQASQGQQQTPQSDKLSSTTSSSVPLSAGAAAAAITSDTMKPPPPLAQQSDSNRTGSHTDAAAEAVANLNQIAMDATKKANKAAAERGLKRKSDDDSGGYNTDDDEGKPQALTAGSAAAAKENEMKQEPAEDSGQGFSEGLSDPSASDPGEGGSRSKKKKLDDSKREERNAREKERSFRISKQINELRNLLSSGGVIVPKGTKSSVLTEAANYIRMLQQHQYRSEIDRHQLVQQVQRIGSGALGQQAAQAVRHAAAQNGVWSLGNFGGVPPKSAMMYHQPGANGVTADEVTSSSSGNSLQSVIEETDYRHVFNSCTIGMAIASMGGAFIDCNKVFCDIANYTKQEVCSMTVFNLTSRADLQPAFDLISQMLSAPLDPSQNTSCVLRGALKQRNDVGLSVKLIKGKDGVAKCFCVTLINNPTGPYDTSRPTPAMVAQPGQLPGPKDGQNSMDQSPAYTTG
jgi:PAS domain-containing protein